MKIGIILYNNKGGVIEIISFPKFINDALEYKWAIRVFNTKRLKDKNYSHWDWKYAETE